RLRPEFAAPRGARYVAWMGSCAVLIWALAAAGTPLDLDQAKPYFMDGALRAAAESFRAESWGAAESALRRHLASRGAAERPQAEPLPALTLGRQGQHADAARRFTTLATSYKLLAPFHLLHAAREHLAAGEHELALARAANVPTDSVYADEAQLIMGDALRAL